MDAMRYALFSVEDFKTTRCPYRSVMMDVQGFESTVSTSIPI